MCCCCACGLYWESDEGASVSGDNNGVFGSGTLCIEFNEDVVIVVVVVFAVSRTELVRSGGRLLRCGATGGEVEERWYELKMVDLMGTSEEVSTVFCEVMGGEAALPVAGEASRGSASFKDSGYVEEE